MVMAVDKAQYLELDPLAELTMTYTQDGFQELAKDISKNGLLVPIILRENKILDGRHRHRACMDLGIDIKYKELGEISHEEAIDVVVSNAINKTTSTDASKVEAYLMCKAKKLKQKDMPKVFNRLNINYVRKLSYIEKQNPEYLQVLLRQSGVSLYNREFKKVETYRTINGIWNVLKSNNKTKDEVIEVAEVMEEPKEFDIDVEGYLGNDDIAIQKFWNIHNSLAAQGENAHPASPVGKQILRLIKENVALLKSQG